jgi:type II secretory pathway predicted ATPase ExeA/cell division septation protein DedD
MSDPQNASQVPSTSPGAPASSAGPQIRADQRSSAPRPERAGAPTTSATAARSRLYWFLGTADLNPLDPGSLTYESHFGLREKPFSLLSDPRFFFGKSAHGAAFETLVAGICRREGIMALTGEVGTGKTTLCRAVLQSLDRRAFTAFVPDPFLSREDLLKTLLVDFGVVSMDEVRSGRLRGASRMDLSYPLYEFLASLQPLKAFAVVMIDEAQNLTSEVLEEIRILADLEGRQKLVQVFLVGQPELQGRFNRREMRQLRQRMTVQCELVPLEARDIAPYIEHRLAVAGGDGRTLFSEAALDLVRKTSNGIPRVINLVCDRALSHAASRGGARAEAEDVAWAAEDLRLPVAEKWNAEETPPDPPPSWSPKPVASAAPTLVPMPRPRLVPPVHAAPPAPDGDAGPAPQAITSAGARSGGTGVRLDALDEDFERLTAAPELQPLETKVVSAVPVEPGSEVHKIAESSSERPPDSNGTGRVDDWRASSATSSGLESVFEPESSQSTPRDFRKGLWIIGIGVALASSFGGYLYLSASTSSTETHIEEAAAPPVTAPAMPTPAPATDSVAPALPPPVASADLSVPAAAPVARTPPPTAPAASSAVSGPGPFSLQMATFTSAVRAQLAVEELSSAGFDARAVSVTLQNGDSAIMVMIGRYRDASMAEQALARAKAIPGYETARVVSTASAR